MAMFHVKQNNNDAIAVYNIVCIFARRVKQSMINAHNLPKTGRCWINNMFCFSVDNQRNRLFDRSMFHVKHSNDSGISVYFCGYLCRQVCDYLVSKHLTSMDNSFASAHHSFESIWQPHICIVGRLSKPRQPS